MKNQLPLDYELWNSGYQAIAGVDEAGRGPLAGPVVAAACLFSRHVDIEGINDSKALTPEQRERVFQRLTTDPGVTYSIACVEVEIIDQINILQATLLAMKQAIEKLSSPPDLIIVDGNQLPKTSFNMKAYIKGDARSKLIGAASILAKVTRDRLMKELHFLDERYGFHHHKGYATPAHIAAILKHGYSKYHRKSFKLKANE